MESSKSLMGENWDYLLVLDACRYDYFEKNYENFLPYGNLNKMLSPASSTIEWCKKTFTDYYDNVIYISGNPYINSKAPVEGFFGGKHFSKVIDVWESGWDENIGTVHPKKINEAFLQIRERFPEYRYIVHFMQPHAPYLSLFSNEGDENSNFQGTIARNLKDTFGWRTRKLLGPVLREILGDRIMWKIRKLLKLSPQGPGALVGGEKKTIKEYENNLKIVLKYISSLLDKIEGKIVVTSDHGELLGEDGDFGHYPNASKSELREIPWLVVEGVEKKVKTIPRSERSRIANRIGKLKEDGQI